MSDIKTGTSGSTTISLIVVGVKCHTVPWVPEGFKDLDK